jgi:aminomethyltransferase
MITIRDLGEYSRDFDLDIRNPLSQAGPVWGTLTAADLAAVQGPLGLRRTDPGGVLALTEQVLGPADRWCLLGANVIGVTGWESVPFADQYRAVTTGAGVFVASAMLYLRVSGPGAGAALDMLSPRTLSDLPVGHARFILFTTPAGTIDEEAVVIRTGEEQYELSCGGGKPPGWLADVAQGRDDVTVQENDRFGFNIKGPKRLQAVQSLLHPDEAEPVAKLVNFQSRPARSRNGDQVRVLKTVIGYEVWATEETLHDTWRLILTGRPQIVPCAWEVLATYRLECTNMVFGLYPVDLHSGTSLHEVGFSWMANRGDGHDYIGRKALLESSAHGGLWFAGLRARADGPAPPVGREVRSRSGEFMGYLTSAAPSPRHGAPLGFAHLVPDCVPGSDVLIDDAVWTVCTLPVFGPAPRTGRSRATRRRAQG